MNVYHRHKNGGVEADVLYHWLISQSVQLLSGVQLFATPNRSMPSLPVHHHLPEFTQTHVHQVGDATQPSYPITSPSPAFNLSQHQGLFQWVSSLHAKLLYACVLSHFSRVWLLATPGTAARQAPLSMGFSSKNTGPGCHALLQGIFHPGIEPASLNISSIGRWVLYR